MTARAMVWRAVYAGVLLGALAACGARGSGEDTGAEVEASAARPALPTQPVVVLERAACFGTCPVYAVALHADGRVQFDGRDHVAAMGVQESRVPADSVEALITRLVASGHVSADQSFEEGAPACGRHLPDGPRFELSVTAPTGARHTVRFDAGCMDAPRDLNSLADDVDRVAGTRAWIGADGASQ